MSKQNFNENPEVSKEDPEVLSVKPEVIQKSQELESVSLSSEGYDNPVYTEETGIHEGVSRLSVEDPAALTVTTRSGSAVTSGGNKGLKLNFSKRQWTFLAIFGLANIFRAVSILIGGPFYPPVAKDRGLNDSQIGFVFGSFDFSTFAVCLFFGKFIIPKFGPRLVFILSTLNLGICSIIFGCLELTDEYYFFIIGSFIIRIIGGAGDAGFYPSAFTIFAEEFKGDVSTAIGLFEFLFGVGAIFGPLILGAVIDGIGFLAVYVIVGCIQVVCAVLVYFVVPKPHSDAKSISTEMLEIKNSGERTIGIGKRWYHLLLIPTLLLVVFNLFTAAASIGFITGTLETHLEQFNLTTFETSATFTISNTIYTILTPAWGKITDRQFIPKHAILAVGSGLILTGFSFLGPLPFIKNKSYLWSTLLGLALHGIGIGGAVMSAFPHAVEAVAEYGFADTEETYSLISSVYTLTFTFGNSVGPSVSGVLVDHIGFQWATVFIVGLGLLVILFTILLTMVQRKKRKTSVNQS